MPHSTTTSDSAKADSISLNSSERLMIVANVTTVTSPSPTPQKTHMVSLFHEVVKPFEELSNLEMVFSSRELEEEKFMLIRTLQTVHALSTEGGTQMSGDEWFGKVFKVLSRNITHIRAPAAISSDPPPPPEELGLRMAEQVGVISRQWGTSGRMATHGLLPAFRMTEEGVKLDEERQQQFHQHLKDHESKLADPFSYVSEALKMDNLSVDDVFLQISTPIWIQARPKFPDPVSWRSDVSGCSVAAHQLWWDITHTSEMIRTARAMETPMRRMIGNPQDSHDVAFLAALTLSEREVDAVAQ